MRHLDLCSGIGGFALAAHWMGWETVAFCEINPFCRQVLELHWPGVPIHADVRALDVSCEEFRDIDVLTAGVPCQPSSVAGKRKGSSDERWFWPTVLGVVRVVRPRWVVCENPTGIIGLRPHGLDWVLGELEAAGYQCSAVVLGASAVGAPHLRQRVWIIGRLANADFDGLEGAVGAVVADAGEGRQHASTGGPGGAVLVNATGQRGSPRGNAPRQQSCEGQAGLSARPGGVGGRQVVNPIGGGCTRWSDDEGHRTPDRDVASASGATLGDASRSDAGCGSNEREGAELADGIPALTLPIAAGRGSSAGQPAVADTDGGDGPSERVGGLSGKSNASHGHDADGCPAEVPVAEGVSDAAQPAVGAPVDGLPEVVAQWPLGQGDEQEEWEAPRTLSGVTKRAAKIEAVGNAIVPQCALMVFRAIARMEGEDV